MGRIARSWSLVVAGRQLGFTLIEVLLVVVVIGAVAAAMMSGFVGRSDGAQRRRLAGDLIAELSLARVMAMRRGESIEARLEMAEESVVLRAGDRERRWRRAGLMFEDSGPRAGAVSARFEASGRTQARRWIARAAGEGGTIFEIVFDPVSGSPSLEPPGGVGALITEVR